MILVLATLISKLGLKQLPDHVVHVEEGMKLLLRVKHCHYLPDLLSLVHDSAEERYGVAHRLCFFIVAAHDRLTVRVTTHFHLHQRIQNFVSLTDGA